MQQEHSTQMHKKQSSVFSEEKHHITVLNIQELKEKLTCERKRKESHSSHSFCS